MSTREADRSEAVNVDIWGRGGGTVTMSKYFSRTSSSSPSLSGRVSANNLMNRFEQDEHLIVNCQSSQTSSLQFLPVFEANLHSWRQTTTRPGFDDSAFEGSIKY